MTAVKVKFNTNIAKKVQRVIDKALNDKAIKPILEEEFVRGARAQRYKSLKSSTIENRRRVARNNSTHEDYRANKSNLTLIGRFLDSFKVKISKSSKGIEFTFGPTGKHKRYSPGSGSAPSNADILRGQQDMGRDPLDLKRKRLRLMKDVIKKFLRRKVKNI